MAQYVLPDLAYDFGALEPLVSGKVMELHHGKHHAAYVKNANLALERLDEARTKEDFTRVAALERDFGGFDKFARQMREVAASIMGSGWAALVFEPLGQRLLITQIYDHQSNLSQSGVPLMVLDAWEHAYYLQYEDRKADYFQAVWNLWNWKDVAARFDAARKLHLRVARGAA